MSLTLLIITCAVASLVSSCAGKSLPHDNPHDPMIVPATPTPLPYSVGVKETEKLLMQTFSRCKNDKGRDLTYVIKDGVMLEIQDLVYRDIPWSSILGLSPVEISSDKTWESDTIFRAEVTGHYDISNRKWGYVEGAPKGIDFKITRVEGKFVCNECERYQKISCSKVQEFINETKRYQNN